MYARSATGVLVQHSASVCNSRRAFSAPDVDVQHPSCLFRKWRACSARERVLVQHPACVISKRRVYSSPGMIVRCPAHGKRMHQPACFYSTRRAYSTPVMLVPQVACLFGTRTGACATPGTRDQQTTCLFITRHACSASSANVQLPARAYSNRRACAARTACSVLVQHPPRVISKRRVHSSHGMLVQQPA